MNVPVRWTVGLSALFCFGLVASQSSAADDLIEWSLKLSKQTGRPIFAVAGSKT